MRKGKEHCHMEGNGEDTHRSGFSVHNALVEGTGFSVHGFSAIVERGQVLGPGRRWWQKNG